MTMDERMQEILDIVETSFLNKEEKQTLKDQLQRGGLNDSFFVALNERLTSALRKTGDLYEKIVDEYEARDISIRNDYEAKRNKIEAELDKKLVEIDIVDLVAKEKIFEWYRKETEGNQDYYDRAIKSLFADISRQTIVM
jgi:hypothetical protein